MKSLAQHLTLKIDFPVASLCISDFKVSRDYLRVGLFQLVGRQQRAILQ